MNADQDDQGRSVREINLDGLVGPTHNYAGLSVGNLASMGNAGAVSSPRRAARQGLAKMRRLHELGVTQGVLPPQQRPDPAVLSALGVASVAELGRRAPGLVPLVMSASPMWAANAATVTPSVDAADGRVHLTPANLSSTTHRSFEPAQTFDLLDAIFADRERFTVHPPLPGATPMADEGAANHGRLAAAHGAAGVQVFVYGRDGDEAISVGGFPRRQSRLASELISGSHRHNPERVAFVRQSGEAIAAGAFHNDVVSVMNGPVLFTHERAFEQSDAAYGDLAAKLRSLGAELTVVEVGEGDVPLADAISSYLFNSQLVTLGDGSMTLIAPADVERVESVADYLERAVDDSANPIRSVHRLDLRESMRNGGGPACLRLRITLDDKERAALRGRILVEDAPGHRDLLSELEAWVDRHYRDELRPDDLADPALVDETQVALDELTGILELGSVYPFQR